MFRRAVIPLLSVCVLAAALLGGCVAATAQPAVEAAPTAPLAEQPAPPPSTSAPAVPMRVTPLQAPATLALTVIPTGAPADTPAPPATASAISGVEIRLPYRAWGVAPTGQLYLLDASGLLHRFSPDLTRIVDVSGPLFDTRDPGPSHMAMSDRFSDIIFREPHAHACARTRVVCPTGRARPSGSRYARWLATFVRLGG